MCPDALEDAIRHYVRVNKKPKAIIVVHLYGMPAMLDEIMFLCKKYDIPLIEDAAEALGSEYKGRKVGTFGDIGILSFNGNKIITTSGGGALLSDNKSYVEKAAFLATQARDRAPHYEHSEIGYNYRMSNVCAGIGRGQLEVIGDRVKQRRAVFELYIKHLGACQGMIFQQESAGSHSNRWLTSMLLGEAAHAERVRHQLQSANIEARPVWKPMHLQSLYGECDFFGGCVSESLFQNGVCLPSGSGLSHEEILEVCGVISECFV
jgi:pyridoxal phosphate-dependent aminotransferase EpsN